MRIWRAWVELLDRKEPPTALAMVRILLASVLLIDFVNVRIAGLVEPIYSPPPLGFAWGDAWLSGNAAWALAVVSLAAIVLGAATRVACIGFVLASAALSHLTPDSESGLDMLARIVFVILALSRCNARWSIDAWLARRLGREVPAEVPAWPRYLALGQSQAQEPVGVIYPLTRIATALTMAFELGAPLFLLAYFKRWRARWIWIALGVSFEVGIAVGLRLGSFPFGMLALYPVLLHPDQLHMPRSRHAK